MSGDRAVLARMKELWSYLLFSFTGRERYVRRFRKVNFLPEYEDLVDEAVSAGTDGVRRLRPGTAVKQNRNMTERGPPHGAALCLRLFLFIIAHQLKDAQTQPGEQKDQREDEGNGEY